MGLCCVSVQRGSFLNSVKPDRLTRAQQLGAVSDSLNSLLRRIGPILDGGKSK